MIYEILRSLNINIKLITLSYAPVFSTYFIVRLIAANNHQITSGLTLATKPLDSCQIRNAVGAYTVELNTKPLA